MSSPFRNRLFLCCLITSSATADEDLLSLLDMPLSSLADTKVMSSTRSAQSLADTPAAVYVITAKEINRSGARSVADALALAPGLHVAKFSNYDWGISARSSNQALTNSLLVMVDGRSVLNAMFSGVDWDLIPVSMDNIAQIEVVLGPVGTIWGGNAVNGVINIITLDAENAPQGKVSASIGNYGYRELKLHHGTQLSEKSHLSGYAEYLEHKPWASTEERVKSQQHYNVVTGRFGGRLDYQFLNHTLNLQAGAIRSEEDYLWANYHPHLFFPHRPAQEYYEQKMIAQEWFAGGSHIYERANHDRIESDLWLTYSDNNGSDRNASFVRFDVDSRYLFDNLWGTQLMIGGNVRLIQELFHQYSTYDQITAPYLRLVEQSSYLNQSYGVYANWTIPLTESTTFMLGNRWQYHNITDDIYAQPQIRLNHKLSDNQTFWAGWGSAVVTPSRLERSTTFRQNGYVENALFSDGNRYDYYYSYLYKGNDLLGVEKVDTLEAGYRFWQGETVQLSVNGFYSTHKNIRAYAGTGANQWVIQGGESEGSVGTVIEQYTSEYVDPLWTQTYGGEFATKWQPMSNLQVNANYSYKKILGHCDGSICASNSAVALALENQPNHFVNAQVIWDITPQWWLSSALQYVSASTVPSEVGTQAQTGWPSVVNMDMALSWQRSRQWPRITATVENIGARDNYEYPQAYNPFLNDTQYWLQLEWIYSDSQRERR
ncbi:TonB-dependent receptor plug domain-containing protein [Vibrio sp. 10N]|uniref:TonB-dependent receptor plug domain-containing protein n=1 Tax=Vibrio sp. 10N TaxID=3058938 RepID=UPI002812D071|nr:TonB-dependent receptor plug domain-containing protein [Vibrio sp. 10N]